MGIELDRLRTITRLSHADCPDCDNSRWWGLLWMLPIVYWNALYRQGVGRRAKLL